MQWIAPSAKDADTATQEKRLWVAADVLLSPITTREAVLSSNWEVRNLRTLIRPRNERNRADLPLLSVAREKGVFVRSLTDADENHNVIPEDTANYKVVRAGNLVLRRVHAAPVRRRGRRPGSSRCSGGLRDVRQRLGPDSSRWLTA